MFPAPKASAGEDRKASTITVDRQKPKHGVKDGIVRSFEGQE